MAKRRQEEIERDLDRIEELLLSGVSEGTITRALTEPQPKGLGVSSGIVRKYINQVYKRWEQQRIAEAPRRREKVYRMGERLYARSLSKNNFSAAAQALGHLIKMVGAQDPDTSEDRERILSQLGPAPTDPTKMVLYYQRALMLEFTSVIGNERVDPAQRIEYITTFGQRFATLHPKAVAGRRIEELETQLQQFQPPEPTQLADGETEEALQAFAASLRQAVTAPEDDSEGPLDGELVEPVE